MRADDLEQKELTEHLNHYYDEVIASLRKTEAILILGPDPFGGRDDRLVLALHPPRLLDAAEALAQSRDFGAPWRDSDAPLVAWQDISKSAFEGLGRWRRLWPRRVPPSC